MSGKISDNLGRSSGLVKAAGGGGKIGQIVQTVHSGTETLTSTTPTTISSFTVSITPEATSSKILICVYGFFGPPSSAGMSVQLYRDTTQICMGDADGSTIRTTWNDFRVFANSGTRANGTMAPMYLDSPSTTSEIDYSCKWRSESGTIFLNRSNSGSDVTYEPRNMSTITAWEVLA